MDTTQSENLNERTHISTKAANLTYISTLKDVVLEEYTPLDTLTYLANYITSKNSKVLKYLNLLGTPPLDLNIPRESLYFTAFSDYIRLNPIFPSSDVARQIINFYQFYRKINFKESTIQVPDSVFNQLKNSSKAGTLLNIVPISYPIPDFEEGNFAKVLRQSINEYVVTLRSVFEDIGMEEEVSNAEYRNMLFNDSSFTCTNPTEEEEDLNSRRRGMHLMFPAILVTYLLFLMFRNYSLLFLEDCCTKDTSQTYSLNPFFNINYCLYVKIQECNFFPTVLYNDYSDPTIYNDLNFGKLGASEDIQLFRTLSSNISTLKAVSSGEVEILL